VAGEKVAGEELAGEGVAPEKAPPEASAGDAAVSEAAVREDVFAEDVSMAATLCDPHARADPKPAGSDNAQRTEALIGTLARIG
jgi:hypothetical protein